MIINSIAVHEKVTIYKNSNNKIMTSLMYDYIVFNKTRIDPIGIHYPIQLLYPKNYQNIPRKGCLHNASSQNILINTRLKSRST